MRTYLRPNLLLPLPSSADRLCRLLASTAVVSISSTLVLCAPRREDAGALKVVSARFFTDTTPTTQNRYSPSAQQLLAQLERAQSESGVARVQYDRSGNVTFVFLSTSTATNANLLLLKQFSSLNKLKINCAEPPIGPDAISELRSLPGLTDLELRAAMRDLTGDLGGTLVQLHNLKSLHISFCRTEEKGLQLLSSLRSLRRFGVTDDEHFNDDGLAILLPALQSVEDLDFSRTSISGNALKALLRLPRLTRLAIWGTRITQADVSKSTFTHRIDVVGAS